MERGEILLHLLVCPQKWPRFSRLETTRTISGEEKLESPLGATPAPDKPPANGSEKANASQAEATAFESRFSKDDLNTWGAPFLLSRCWTTRVGCSLFGFFQKEAKKENRRSLPAVM